jgi:dTDP-4-amino-4,6-dideoxy-D-galactose acyltransferase
MFINAIECLEWDSRFFGYSVAKIVLDAQGYYLIEDLFRQIVTEKIRLTYLFVPISQTRLNILISDKGSILVDQKTVFSKKTEKHIRFSNDIIEYQETEINDRLINLVLQAGLFSRFRLDINFSDKEYEKLYIEWLTKSINKTLAIKTFVVKNGSEIIGITTLGERSKFADIGLVAVDKNFRGRGIAYDLIHSADNTACGLGYDEIKVVTQLQNKGACRLYEKCNFQIESITNVYHYWQ